MAKPKSAPVKSEPAPEIPPKPKYLPWPTNPKELSPVPRLFRIHRMNAFEWQAYVVTNIPEEGVFEEHPIGKPDVFDIIRNRVAGVMRAEGQMKFLADKTRVELERQRLSLVQSENAHGK